LAGWGLSMPIKPENRARYPKDWLQIRERILQRAGRRCEHEGCIARHLELGYWEGECWVPLPRALHDAGCKAGSRVASADGTELKIIMIVLTIAHLDHTPEHCADDNLRAWCQRHHLAYDAEHHKANAWRTRRERANTRELF
jgi:hypothetical protein